LAAVVNSIGRVHGLDLFLVLHVTLALGKNRWCGLLDPGVVERFAHAAERESSAHEAKKLWAETESLGCEVVSEVA
jgi:hypothetical protein